MTVNEIIEKLGEHGVFPHRDDVLLYVKRYSNKKGGTAEKLSFDEFCPSFTPNNESNYAWKVRTGSFNKETLRKTLSAFRTHFAVEAKAEDLRKKL